MLHTIMQSFDAVKLTASIVSSLQQLPNFLEMLANQQLFAGREIAPNTGANATKFSPLALATKS